MACTQKRFSYRKATEAAEKEIRTLMARAAEKRGTYEEDLLRGFAYGVYLGWCAITGNWHLDGDNARLEALTVRPK